ncbi:MAG: choice-of-anchor tandem repeat GloVer-containing protein [Candidatus Korobacteraceae bacterium]
MKAFHLARVTGIFVLFCAAMGIGSGAQNLTTLVTFDGTNGSAPAAPLIQASNGNLYGTTEYGGPINGCEGGFNPCGTVFKTTLSGTLTTLHTFVYSDGAFPLSPVVQGTDGSFYGTNQGEGDSGGAGAIFKMTPGGTVTVLSFTSSPAGLVQGRDGNFYGTTPRSYTDGTVFKITPSGTLTTLHTFEGTDGDNPQAGLIQATDGDFYGTTYSGGTSSYCSYGCGTVFKMTSGGSLTSLHSFSGPDGYNVQAGLVEGTDGNLYGTTVNGGAQNVGEVFKITRSGTLTVLYSFCSQPSCTDGSYPKAALMQASDGNFYGTTSSSGAYGQGTVFAITPSGSLTTLYSFCRQSGCPDGANPIAAVIQASDGNFYGTTYAGGANNSGTVFKLSVSYNTLTVTTSGNGVVTSTDGHIDCPGTCSQEYLNNTQVTLNVTPASGWAFTGWSGACSGTGSCQVTMTQNTNVSAAFYQLPVTLTVSVAGTGSVTSTDGFINCPGTCTHIYQPNTQVTLNATAASGWIFSGWTGVCIGVGSCDITMTQSLAVTAVFVEPGHGIQFTPVTPCRLVDTRQTNDPIQGGTSQSYTLPQLGGCNIPTSAAAYSLNVTVVPLTTLGYLTIWPTGEAQPVVSTMNSPDGRIKANAAIVPAGTSGAVSVYVTDTSNVILDIDGYFETAGAATYQFYPLTPCRLVDTRGTDADLGGPRLAAQTPRSFPLLESSCIPSGLSPMAYSLNFTVVPNPSRQALGYLSVWPAGETQPVVSTLNNPTATVVANAAIVPAGTSGDIEVYAYNTTDLLIDINGYFAAPGAGGSSMYAAAPCRVLDTRQNNGQPFMDEKPVNVEGSACAPPSNAAAYIFNATVVPPGAMLYLTLWPNGEQQPVVSTLNAEDGFITSNMAIVPTTNGSIDAYAYALTQLILDISGYFAP